jgi:hypothetical protein
VIGWRSVYKFEGSRKPRDLKIQRMTLLKLLSRSSGALQRRSVRLDVLEVWKSTMVNVPLKVRLECSTASMKCIVYCIKAKDEL